jgi:hypothetical protein
VNINIPRDLRLSIPPGQFTDPVTAHTNINTRLIYLQRLCFGGLVSYQAAFDKHRRLLRCFIGFLGYTLRVLRYTIEALRYTIRVLRYTIEALRYTIRVLRYTIEVLRYTIRVLRYTIEVLRYTIRVLGYTIEVLWYTIRVTLFTYTAQEVINAE